MHSLSLAVPLGTGLFALCVGLAGCAPATSQISGAAVEGAVETVEESENLERINEIASNENFQGSVEQLGAALTRGVAAGGQADEVGEATEYVGAALARGLVAGFEDSMGGIPDPQAIVNDTIDGALASASSERNRERASLVAADVTAAIVRSMTASLAAGIEEDLRPAVESVSNDAAPTVAKALSDDELRLALGGMVYEVSRQTALGFDQGMEQIRQENRAQEEGVLGRMSMVGWAVLAALAVLLLGAIIAIIVLGVSNSRRRRDREQVLTSMVAAYAAKDEGMDEDARAELLRRLGVEPRRAAEPRPPEARGPGPQSGLIPAHE